MNLKIDPELDDFIRRLPKTETHLHIEAAVPYRLVTDLHPGRFPDRLESWHEDFRFDTFKQFEDSLFAVALEWYTSAERYHQAAKAVIEELRRENVRYLETSFHIGIIEHLGVPGEEIIQAIKEAAPADFEIRVFMGIWRDHYQGPLKKVIDDMPNWKELDGVDIHGSEEKPLEEWNARAWAEARQAGKLTKAHAGEFTGAGSVREVLDFLEVERIEHGIGAVEAPELVARLAEEGVPLDICPISNYKLRAVESMDTHPIRRLFEAGVRCTVSRDDPTVFGNTLHQEYAALAGNLDFDHSELAAVARTGFEIALLPEDIKRRHIEEIEAMNFS